MVSKSPAEYAYDLLAATAAIAPAYTGRIGRLTDTPDRQIVIYDTGGMAPNPAHRLNYYTIQVRVRAPVDGYSEGWARTKKVQDALLGIPPQDLGSDGDHLDGIIGVGDISFLLTDESNRPNFVVNFQLFFEPGTGTYRDSL